MLQGPETLSPGQAAPPQEAGIVTLLLLLFVPDPHGLEQVLQLLQEETAQGSKM